MRGSTAEARKEAKQVGDEEKTAENKLASYCVQADADDSHAGEMSLPAKDRGGEVDLVADRAALVRV